MPKSRARRRGPRDRRGHEDSASLDEQTKQFAARIEAWLALEQRMEQLHALDLRGFLQACPHERYGPGERLRRLAIYLDGSGRVWHEQVMRSWAVFERIYDAAERYAPEDPWLFHSRGLTAVELGRYERDERARLRLLDIAWRAAARGLALDDDDADLHWLAGYVAYFDAARGAAQALSHFEATLALRSDYPWAGLYRAHCLHDLERWPEAAAAYGEIISAKFGEHKTWRNELAREQRAYCLWRAGEAVEALAAFEALLERREQAIAGGASSIERPVLATPPYLLAEAALSERLGPALMPRLRAQLEARDELWVLEKVEPD